MLTSNGQVKSSSVKPVTIPRLEHTAAVVSVKISKLIASEVAIDNLQQIFWTYSRVVLGYNNNDARHFKLFVANRVQHIRNHSEPSQWRFVKSEENPADTASRGLTVTQLLHSNWLRGPDFLYSFEIPDEDYEISSSDPEVKEAHVMATSQLTPNPLTTLMESSSSWLQTKQRVAVWLEVKHILHDRIKGKRTTCNDYNPFCVEKLRDAELAIIRYVQLEVFPKEIGFLRKMTDSVSEREKRRRHKETLKTTSSLYRLDPLLDSSGILRVGGRLSQSKFPIEYRKPIILPRKHHITTLVIRDCHIQTAHQGRGMTANEIRSRGYWVIGCSSAVASLISSCVMLRRIRGMF